MATYRPQSHPSGDQLLRTGHSRTPVMTSDPPNDRTFPLDQAPEEMRHLIEDRPYGKATLAPTDPADARRRAVTVVCVVVQGRRAPLLVEGKPVVMQRSIGQQPSSEIWQPTAEQIAVRSCGRCDLDRIACRLPPQLGGADNRAETP
jgi:hypothetical protein